VVVDAQRVSIRGGGDVNQTDTRPVTSSIGTAVAGAPLVNVTYLTADTREIDAVSSADSLVFTDFCPFDSVTAARPLVRIDRTLTTYTDGRWIEIKQPSFGAVNGGGLRGSVSTFSAQSRKRFMKKIYILQSSSRCLWITLTQPAAFVGSIGARRMAKLWTARVRRAYPDACGLWRIQPQKRGAPHFHVMVYGIPANGLDVKAVRVALSKMWTSVVVAGIENGSQLSAKSRGQIARYGCDVAEMDTSSGVQRYASRYLSRTDAAGNAAVAGRQWGVFNRDALPVSVTDTVTVTRAVAQNVVRAVRRSQTRTYTRANGKAVKWQPKYRTTSSASFIGSPSVWTRYVDYLTSGGGAVVTVSPVVNLTGETFAVDGRDAVSKRVQSGRQSARPRDAVRASIFAAVSVVNVDAVSVSPDAVQTVE